MQQPIILGFTMWTVRRILWAGLTIVDTLSLTPATWPHIPRVWLRPHVRIYLESDYGHMAAAYMAAYNSSLTTATWPRRIWPHIPRVWLRPHGRGVFGRIYLESDYGHMAAYTSSLTTATWPLRIWPHIPRVWLRPHGRGVQGNAAVFYDWFIIRYPYSIFIEHGYCYGINLSTTAL